MKLPKKITPCPVFDTTVEIRFDALLPSEAVFGVLYEKFKDDYKSYEKLPILQLPEEIRSSDPNLIFQPHYKLIKDGFVIQIGPKILSVGCFGEYVGWDFYFKEVKAVFLKAKKTSIFREINRAGIRYINFFDLNIFKNVKLDINIGKSWIGEEPTLFKTVMKSERLIKTLQIANNVSLQRGTKILTGSVIDIDSATDGQHDIYDNLNEILEKAHLEEKKLFFKLLKEDFLASLNPEF